MPQGDFVQNHWGSKSLSWHPPTRNPHGKRNCNKSSSRRDSRGLFFRNLRGNAVEHVSESTTANPSPPRHSDTRRRSRLEPAVSPPARGTTVTPRSHPSSGTASVYLGPKSVPTLILSPALPRMHIVASTVLAWCRNVARMDRTGGLAT